MNIGFLLVPFLLLNLVHEAYTKRNDCCSFPFKYDGKIYNRCIKKGYSKYWCATSVNQDQTYKEWSVCDSSCRSGL